MTVRWLPVKPTVLGTPWPVLHDGHEGLNDGDMDMAHSFRLLEEGCMSSRHAGFGSSSLEAKG